jgi:hypothetical protein
MKTFKFLVMILFATTIYAGSPEANTNTADVTAINEASISTPVNTFKTTSIQFNGNETGTIKLTVFGANGQVIQNQYGDVAEAKMVNASDVIPGMFFNKADAGTNTNANKILLANN